jgi:hypothetical protein
MSVLIDSLDRLQKHARRMGVFHGITYPTTRDAIFENVSLRIVMPIDTVVDITRLSRCFGLARRLSTVFTGLLCKFCKLLFREAEIEPSFFCLYFILGEQLIECGNTWRFPKKSPSHLRQTLMTTSCPALSKISSGTVCYFPTRAFTKPSSPFNVRSVRNVRY